MRPGFLNSFQPFWGPASAGAPVDADFSDVVLLMPGNGANGAQNATFLDSSVNNFTLTSVGAPAQGAFTPFSKGPGEWGAWSPDRGLAYNGNSLLVNGTQTTGNIGTDFTVEFWVNGAPNTSSGLIVAKTRGITNSADCWQTGVTASGININKFYFLVYHGSPTTIKIFHSTSIVADNKWHHCAAVKQGTTYRMFVDGVLESTEVFATPLTGSSYNISLLGCTNDPSGYDYSRVNTFASNVRVTNTAVYTSSFTPSTSPLTAIPGTVVLALQDNRFIDNGPNNYSITVQQGSPAMSPFSPFVGTAYSTLTTGGEGYFDGASYLSAPASPVFNFGTGDLTVEAFVWWDGTYASNARIIYSTAGAGGYDQLGLFNSVAIPPSGGIFYAGVTATGVLPVPYTWNHIAATRQGSTVRIFLNGALVGSGTYAGNVGSSVTGPNIGRRTDGFHPWVGGISNLRVVKGTALYTSAFTPPTTPLTAVAGTSLLMNATNAGVVDAAKQNVAKTEGAAQISTAQSKWGGSSVFFPAAAPAANRLAFNSGPIYSLGATFTVELWMYPLVIPSATSRVLMFGTNATTSAATLQILSTGALQWIVANVPASPVGVATAGGVVTAGAWAHYAVSVNNGTARIFKDGVLVGGPTAITTQAAAPIPLYVGYDVTVSPVSNAQFNGYINDLRITRGVARYTAAFSPPTQAFPLT